jgi:membrane protease YdiL (CAAX protease family)
LFSFSFSLKSIDIKKERRNIANIAMGIASIMFFTAAAQLIVALLLAAVAPDLLSSTLVALCINAVTMYGFGMPMSMLFFRKCNTEPIHGKPLGVGAMILTIPICFGLTFLGSIIGTLADEFTAGLLGTSASNPVAETTASIDPWAILLFLVILAPIFEEIFFRRVVIDRLRRYGDAPAIIFSGLAFGLIHGNFSQFFYATFLGMLFGAIYIHTGKLRHTIFLHMVVNFMGGFYTTVMVGSPAEELMTIALSMLYLVSLGLTIPAFLYVSGKIKLQKGSVTLDHQQARRVRFFNLGLWLSVLYLIANFATSLLIS